MLKYLTLISEMAQNNVTLEAISQFLDLPKDTVSCKLNGGSFDIEEAYRVRDKFFPERDVGKLFQKDEDVDMKSD